MANYKVVKNGKRWDIVDARTDKVVEGGFFTRDAALRACEDWEEGGF